MTTPKIVSEMMTLTWSVCECYLVDAIGFICGVLKLTFCSKMVNILWLVLMHAIGFTSFENFFYILKILILKFV